MVLLLADAVWVTWRGPRTDSARASLIIFGGWLLSSGVTFAYMQGTIHPYYTVALAPAIGALAGIGSVLLWRQRAVAPRAAYPVLALTVLVTAGWGFELLQTDTSFHPAVTYLAVAAAAAAVALLAAAAVRTRIGRRLIVATGVLTAMAVAVPTAAWAVGTAATPHPGSIPTAVSGSGSAGFAAGTGGGFGGGAPGGGGGEFGDGGQPARGEAGAPQDGLPSGSSRVGSGGGSPGGAGTSSALDKALEKTTTRWAAAVEGSNSAASLELASDGKAVMAMGGFTGSDPAPTPAEFEQSARGPYGSSELLTTVIERARQDAADAEREQVAGEIRDLVARSGLSQQDFAVRLGTSRPRLSTYMSGKVIPSASLMLRMRRVAAHTQAGDGSH